MAVSCPGQSTGVDLIVLSFEVRTSICEVWMLCEWDQSMKGKEQIKSKQKNPLIAIIKDYKMLALYFAF
jgi:hypothetical protein